MNRTEFWDLIEKSKQLADQSEWLTKLLSKMELQEIADFKAYFNYYMAVSDVDLLWEALNITSNYASDDGFIYFRGWLIAQGEEVFTKVLENPDTLAEYVEYEKRNDIDKEEMLYVGRQAYFLRKVGTTAYNTDIESEIKIDHEFNYECMLAEERIDVPEINVMKERKEKQLDKVFPELWKKFKNL